MRNHGLLTCGATVQQAFNTMYQLELSCRSQVDAMAARAELTMPGENVLAHTAHMYQPGTRDPTACLNGRRCCAGSTPSRRTRLTRRIGTKKFCNPGDVMLTLLSRVMMVASLLFARRRTLRPMTIRTDPCG